MRAHGCRLAGEMSGGGLRSVAWAGAITLVESSVITLEIVDLRHSACGHNEV